MKLKLIFIIFILIIISLKLVSPFTSTTDYILNTPGFGNESYKIPITDLNSENIILNDSQYTLFFKYMTSDPNIIIFMSDNSQISLLPDAKVNISDLSISGNTISYNQAIGTNSGTSTKIGQDNPPTIFQINRTLLIISVIDSLAKLYCSNSRANDGTKFISNCAKGDLIANLDSFYYLKKGNSFDYNTYTAIWYTLYNRYYDLVQRLKNVKNL